MIYDTKVNRKHVIRKFCKAKRIKLEMTRSKSEIKHFGTLYFVQT